MIASSNLSLSGGSVASRKGVAILFLAGVLVAALAAPAASAPPAAPSPTSGNKPKPAAAPGKPAADAASAVPFGTKSKDPIYITSDRLDIYDKEGRAVYSGASGVVATQGASKLVGTELTAYYDRQHDNGDKTCGRPAAATRGRRNASEAHSGQGSRERGPERPGRDRRQWRIRSRAEHRHFDRPCFLDARRGRHDRRQADL